MTGTLQMNTICEYHAQSLTATQHEHGEKNTNAIHEHLTFGNRQNLRKRVAQSLKGTLYHEQDEKRVNSIHYTFGHRYNLRKCLNFVTASYNV